MINDFRYSTDTIHRWWGCYPVIAGVSSNGWVAVEPNSGQEIQVCEDDTALMSGNSPAAAAIGTWTIAVKPAGAPDPTFDNLNDSATIVRNMTFYGEYIFEWNINYNNCPATPDSVSIFIFQQPPNSNAGVDQILACEEDSTTLLANDPGVQTNGVGGQGVWTLLQGTATIADTLDSATTVTNLGYGWTQFVWKIANGLCIPTTDTVAVFRYKQPVADAGIVQNICDTTTILSGNDPLSIQDSVVGSWIQISGVAVASFNDTSIFNPTVTSLDSSLNEFVWILSNGNCSSDSDTVSVMVYEPVTVTAGNDVALCDSNLVILSGNSPLAFQSTAIGYWTQLSGDTLQISDSSVVQLSLNNLGAGAYQLEWTVENGVCPQAIDTVNIAIYNNPIVGVDSTVNFCGNADTVALVSINPDTTQNTAFGYWQQAVGSSIIDDTASFSTFATGVGVGTTIYQWILSNGVCLADTMQITVELSNTVSVNAGVDQELCEAQSVTLTATPVGNGIWTQITGVGSISDSDSSTATATLGSNGITTFVWEVPISGCPSVFDTVQVVDYEKPTANAGNDSPFCNDIQLDGNDPALLSPPGSGYWLNYGVGTIVDSTLYNSSATSDGNSTVTYVWTVQNGVCPSSSDTVNYTLAVITNNGATTTSTDYEINNGSVTINPPLDGTAPYIYSVGYDFPGTNDTNNIISGLIAGMHQGYVMDANGCYDTLTFEVAQNPFIATGFSPNGDGVNDVWEILGIENYPTAIIQVFNIWGGVVFENVGYSIPWDGTKNGKDVPDANYYFIVDLDDGSEPQRGSLTMLR
ncbi:MAG: gliding motility-associated C-terminal domain-containing protein [Flavobacteriales bacterium]|nr:gliding motility-associated C-terminal domain-containing protein [Flavobacteriales bacterium]